MKFISTKYPQLQVYAARVRFRGGKAETRDPDAIEKLLTLRHMGVEPVKEGDASELSEIAPGGPQPSPPEPPGARADAESPAGAAADPDTLPTGGAKEVLVWVAEDPAKAARALEAEQAREKPRSTLVATLTKLAS